MKITRSSEVKKFKSGYLLKEYLLDENITSGFIEFLGYLGISEYFPDFARPFFRITSEGKFVIKGINGNSSFQVFYFNTTGTHEPDITGYIESYNSSQ
jgi:hypothetical protein